MAREGTSAFYDVVIVGSGPSGTAVAEGMADTAPGIKAAIIEMGPLLLRRHFYHEVGGSILDRDVFWGRHSHCPWIGDMSAGGALLPAVGGRGILGGAQLHRFAEADFKAWPTAPWPFGPEELAIFYGMAERALLSTSAVASGAQSYVHNLLQMYNPHVPPHAAGEAEVHPSAGHPHRSSVERLLATVDSATRTNAHLLPGIRALRLENDVTGTVATGLYCVGLNGSPLRRVRGRVFVLAASAIESARLALLSIPRDSLTAAHGGYLAEHIYAESYLDVSRLKAKGSVNLTIPPASRVRVDRFQLEIRSLGSFRGVDSVLRVVGSAAMDPQPGNRVWLSTDSADSLGVPRAITRLRYSEDDRLRTAAMLATMNEVGVALGGEWIVRPRLRPRGSSYHEAGALRYQAGQGGVTDVAGRLSPYRNVYVGDASVFPCVGVANPILTLTALGYRLGRHLAEALNSGARF